MSRLSSPYVRCRACSHRVYHRARRCPNCGRRMRWDLKSLAVWAIAAAIAILLGYGLANRLTVDDRPSPTPSFENP